MCCLTRDGFAKAVNEQCFGIKALIILAGYIGCVFIPKGFFSVYGYITDGASCLFLIVQSITLIDFSYLWAEDWAMRYDKGNKCYGVLLIVFAVILYSGCAFILVEMFINYTNTCGANWVWLIINCLLPIAWTVLILLKLHPTGSIITSGSLSIIITYLG